MQKIKEFIKKYMVGLSLSFLICIVSVSAITYFDSKNVTYSNETTGMSSSNVQDAVNELYNVCFPPEPITPDDLIEGAVTTGDGLYKDEYEDGKYTYKGANPNNYVTFNNETAGWRIISINSDGTIKIMKNESIGNIVWDTAGNNNWSRPATLNTYLNETYYNSLTSTAQNQIVVGNYSIGAVTEDNNDLADQVNDENGTTWKGNVALATVSEYIRSNSNKNICGTFSLNNKISICSNTMWMYTSSATWLTLSPDSGTSETVFEIHSGDGYVAVATAGYNRDAIRPTVTLSSKIKITGGDGSKSNPYTIE